MKNLMVNSTSKQVREAFASNIDKVILNYGKEADVKGVIEQIQTLQANQSNAPSAGKEPFSKNTKNFMFQTEEI